MALGKPVPALDNHSRLPELNSTAIEPEERCGLWGLSYDIIVAATGGKPYITAVRAGGGNSSHTGFSGFPSNWATRCQLLFDWDDGFDRGSWDERPWRKWTRECYSMLLGSEIKDFAEVFRRNIGIYAQPYLQVLPHYEKSKLYHPPKNKTVPRDRTESMYRVAWIAAMPRFKRPTDGPPHLPSHWDIVATVQQVSILERFFQTEPLAFEPRWLDKLSNELREAAIMAQAQKAASIEEEEEEET